jgi:hypothetical protein
MRPPTIAAQMAPLGLSRTTSSTRRHQQQEPTP